MIYYNAILQNKNMPPNLILVKGMQLRSYDEAKGFYNTYGRHASLATCKGARYRTNNYIVCPRQGKHKESFTDCEWKRDKTSKWIGCQGKIRVKERKNGCFVIEEVELRHNHKMIESPVMLDTSPSIYNL
jgi:hypothetical protein